MRYPTVLTGQDCKAYWNGSLLGYVVSSTWSLNSDFRAVREIDAAITKELIPGGYSASGNLSLVRGRSTGGAEGLGLTSSAEKLLRQKYGKLEIYDRLTDQVIFRAIKCQVVSQTWSISPKQIVMGNLQWIACDFENEAVD